MSKSELLKNTLAANAYWMVNKAIARQVGFNAAILLSDLISKRAYFESRNELQPDGSFFNTTDNIENDLGIGKDARISAQKSLVMAGFLKIVKRGMPSKNFYVIRDDVITGALVDQTSRNLDNKTSKNKNHSPPQTNPLIRIKNKNKVNNAIHADQASDSQDGENDGFPEEAVGAQRGDIIFDIPEKLVSLSFEDIVYQLDITPAKLVSAEKEDTLEILVNTCKDNGLSRDQVSSSKLVKLTMNSLKNTSQNNSWKDDIASCFNKAVAVAYAPKVVPSMTNEEKAHKRRQIFNEFKLRQATKEPSIFDSPEFLEAEAQAYADEKKNNSN